MKLIFWKIIKTILFYSFWFFIMFFGLGKWIDSFSISTHVILVFILMIAFFILLIGSLIEIVLIFKKLNSLNKCKICKKPYTKTGLKLHQISKSRLLFQRPTKIKRYDVSTSNQLTCESQICFSKEGFKVSPPRLRYVFLKKDSILYKFKKKGNIITNEFTLETE
jgi:uncharacterized membrane protein YcgQ (UPF0703/DUF1980 family)